MDPPAPPGSGRRHARACRDSLQPRYDRRGSPRASAPRSSHARCGCGGAPTGTRTRIEGGLGTPGSALELWALVSSLPLRGHETFEALQVVAQLRDVAVVLAATDEHGPIGRALVAAVAQLVLQAHDALEVHAALDRKS